MRIRHMEVPDAVRAGTEVALNCDYDLQVGKQLFQFDLLEVTLVCDDSYPFLITTCSLQVACGDNREGFKNPGYGKCLWWGGGGPPFSVKFFC